MLPDSAAVEPLLAERDALHGWLMRLDEAGSSTPQSVRAKVRLDYEARLDVVTERLRGHADTIADRLADDQAEYADHLAQLASAEAALAEAELRHAVGEYDSAQFEREQARHGDEIVRCRLGRDAARERIERMEAVHALVTQPIVSVESLAPTPVATSEVLPRPTLVDVAPVQTPVSEDRFEDALLSVFDEPRVATPANEYSPLSFRPGNGMPQDNTRFAPQRSTPSMAEIPAFGTPADTPPRFTRPVDPAPAMIPATLVPETVASAPTPPPAVDDALFGNNAIVAAGPTPDLAAPANRTLRCSECGAMNKPLEWYCEKCGAELTAN